MEKIVNRICLELTRSSMEDIKECQIKGFTYPHICSVHMIKIRKQIDDKQKKKFAMYCFALLQTESSLQHAKEVFACMCFVFRSPYKVSRMELSLNFLHQLINKSGIGKAIEGESLDVYNNVYNKRPVYKEIFTLA